MSPKGINLPRHHRREAERLRKEKALPFRRHLAQLAAGVAKAIKNRKTKTVAAWRVWQARGLTANALARTKLAFIRATMIRCELHAGGR